MLYPRSRLVVLLLVLASTGWVLGWALWQRSETRWFCEAAQHPKAYQNEWFYTLQKGRDGWLLRHDDLRATFTLEPHTLADLSRFHRVLLERGVTLIIVAQPPRGVALSGRSVPNYDPGVASQRYREIRTALLSGGVLTADLGTAARGTPSYFFKRDHHWTPEGARASAGATAALIGATAAYSSLTPRAYRTERVAQSTQVGSYGEAVGRICGQDPPAERFTRYQTRPQNAAQSGTKHFGAEQNLFDDAPVPPIALAGTSNSASEEFNFAGFLAQETGLEVLNVSAVGGGPEAALSSYLRSPAFTEAPPPFLVWEFATLFDLPSRATFYRQLIPSAVGACSSSQSLQNTRQSAAGGTLPLFENLGPEDAGSKGPDSDGPDVDDSNTDNPNTDNLGIDNPGIDNPDAPRFLYLEATDLSLVNFEVNVSYQNGQTETVRLERPTRTANDGRFFLELTGAVSSLSLTLPQGVGGEVSARLCP